MFASQYTTSLKRLHELGLDDYVHCLSWAPDGRHIAVGLSTGKICVVRVSDGSIQMSWQAHTRDLMALDWSRTGTVLASGGQDGHVCLWEPFSGVCLSQATYNAWIEVLSWSPNGLQLAVATGRQVDLLSLQGDLIRSYVDHSSTVLDLQWAANGKRVLSASYGEIRLLPLRGKEPRPLPWKTSLISLALSPDGRFLAAGTQDASIHFWPLPHRSGSELQMFGYPGKINLLDWDSSGRYLASNGRTEIIIWDTSGHGPANTRPCVLAPHFHKLSCFQFMPGRLLLASGDVAGVVRLCQLNEADPVLDQDELPGEITAIQWSSREGLLAAGSSQGGLVLWKIKDFSEQIQGKVLQSWLN